MPATEPAPILDLDWLRDRYRRIIALREEGLSYGAIGRMMDPPLSKQRVSSIIERGEPQRATGRPKAQP